MFTKPRSSSPHAQSTMTLSSHIHNLAFEILGMIFDAIISSPNPQIDARTWSEQKGMHIPYTWTNDLSPLSLSMVCRKWRSVVLHTPRLWRFLRVDTNPHNKARQRERMSAYLERSGVVGLEVFYDSFEGVHTTEPLDPKLIQLLRPSTKRWISFQARYMGSAHVYQFAPLLEDAHRLETLFLTQLPLDGPPDTRTYPDIMPNGYLRPFLDKDGNFRNWSFSRLKRLGYNDLEQTSIMSAEEFAHLLCSTRVLERLWISSVDRLSILQEEDQSWKTQTRIKLSHLSHLNLHPSAMINLITPQLLTMLELPLLTSLHFNLLDYLPLPESIDLLLCFLRAHSNGTIQDRFALITNLSLEAARGDSEVLTIMSMLPDVEHLVIWGSVLEGTAQFCKAFGGPMEWSEYLQMNPFLDDDWEFDEMLRMEEEERKQGDGEEMKKRVHDSNTCKECEDPLGEEEEELDIKKTTHVTLDTTNCILTSAQPQPITEQQVDERERPALFSRGDEDVKSAIKERHSISISEATHRQQLIEEKGNWEREEKQTVELVVSSGRNSTLSVYRHSLANGNMFTSWMLPNLSSIHFRTTKFYRGENTLLLLQMLKRRQDAARGILTFEDKDGKRSMLPVELKATCLKDIRLCRICRPRFVRLRDELGVGWDKGIARTLCTYMKSEFDEMEYDVDVFFEECHTAWDVTNRAGPCTVCP